MLKFMMPAAAISLMAVSSAWALPAGSPAMNHVQGGLNVIEVQYHHGSAKPSRSMHHRQNAGRGHSYRGRHYAHRYSSRPRDWSQRNCVMAGPLWFCP